MNDELYEIKPKKRAVAKEWPDKFYDVEDATKRFRFLKDHREEVGENEEDSMRLQLLKKRYSLRDDRYIDNYLMPLMEIRMNGSEKVGALQRKRVLKSTEAALQTIFPFGQDQLQEGSLMTREVYHSMMVYISHCKTDKQYGSVILGLGKKTEDALHTKIYGDMKSMVTLDQQITLSEEGSVRMKLLKKAVVEAYAEHFPAEEGYIRRLQAYLD